MGSKRGFTLVEVIVVLTIIAIVSTLGFVSYFGYIKDGNDFKRISDVTMLKTNLEVYRKTHSSYVFLSGSTNIMSGATLIASQGLLDDALVGKLNMPNGLKDPKTKNPYIYSISKSGEAYQIAATLENSSNLLSFDPVDKAYAANGGNSFVALVDGNFVPEDRTILPGLIYSVVNGQKFVPGTPVSFDISTSTGKARVILNGQNINLTYDMNGNMISNDGTLSLTGLLSKTSVAQNSTISQSLYCSGATKKFAPGENEIIQTMTGAAIGAQIGWRYQTCNGDTGLMGSVKYACANIQGANFDSVCAWISCQSGYTPVVSPNPLAPYCMTNILAPILIYPQNGAYNTPISGNLSWNSVAGSVGGYKVYFGTDIGTLGLVATVAPTNYAFTNLSKGTTYYWKINTCNASAQCTDSQIWSFTTLPEAGGGGGGTGSSAPVDTAFCPSGLVCRADDVVVEYVGCDNGTSTFKNCLLDNFGTSERDGQEYYGKTKTLGYKVKNNSNGTAKFKIQLSDASGGYEEKYTSTDFDAANSMYLGGTGVAKSYYWKKGDGCGGDGASGYTVAGKTSCYIQLYYRGGPQIADSPGIIAKMKVINSDTANGMWPDVEKQLSGNISGYSLSELIITGSTLKTYQAGEPSGPTTVINDFDTSTFVGGQQYGYWKTLTYVLTNPNNSTSYFNVGLGDTTFSALASVNSTGGLDTDFNIAGSNFDIGENTIGNIYFYNGDTSGNFKCTPYLSGLSIGNFNFCKVTLYFRSDRAVSSTRSIVANLKFINQPVATPSGVTTIGLYGKKLGGNTLLFTGYMPYSQNGWWIDFTGFQIQDDLTPTGFVWSRVMGWIDMSGLEPGSTIKIKYIAGVKKIKGKTYSQTAGWIDFDKVTDPAKQAYVATDGKLHGWTWSQNYGWISFDDGVY